MSGRYAGQAALVTGASGFIGSRLAERLLAEGARVVVPKRPGASSLPPELEGRCEVVAMDLLDPPSLIRVLNERGIDSVFHLAAQTIVGAAAEAPLAAFEVNATGTYNLLEACRVLSAERECPRVVCASTYHVYGAHDSDCFSEETPLRPRNPYEASKACGDMLARCYAATYGMPGAVTRLANVYGGGDRNESRLVPSAAHALVRGEAPVINSDGTPERDFIYIDDAVDAYLAVAGSLGEEAHRGRAWNAGSGTPVSIADLVGRLTAASGKDLEPDVRGTPDPEAPVDRQYLDSGPIEHELGWQARTDLDSGLAATYSWYAEHAS